jgi:hypothetical protein
VSDPVQDPVDAVQEALDRASGKQWPRDRDARIAFAIKDRRVLALEVIRLQRLVGLADPEAAARLDAALRRVAAEVTSEVWGGSDRDPA